MSRRPGREPFTHGVIAVLEIALGQTNRLGHRYLGAEHLLLAVASAGQPVGAVLRDYGVTPERVQQEIVRQIGPGPGAGLFGGLDRDALAAIGVDLDSVRARIESSFEAEDLTRAGQAAHPHRPKVSARLIRRWHRRHAATMAPIPLRAAAGLWRRDRDATIFVPFAPSALESLQNIRRAARAQHNAKPDVEHIALALIGVTDGPVPAILSSLDVTPQVLRTAILNRYRQAS
jgi:ATP-dependent Clp protease ATP-binding subunit ClpA